MLNFKSSSEIYDAGYCVMKYDIYKDRDVWRHLDILWELPSGLVPTIINGGLPVQVATLNDVVTAFERAQREAAGGKDH